MAVIGMPSPKGGGDAVAWCSRHWRGGRGGQGGRCWWLLMCVEVEVRVLKVTGRGVTGEDCCLPGT